MMPMCAQGELRWLGVPFNIPPEGGALFGEVGEAAKVIIR